MVWTSDINQLEKVDRLLLRQVFNVSSTCPVEALYLELGCIPIGLIIKSRRVNYLHHLVTREEKEMLSTFFTTPWNFPAKRNEWTEQVRVNPQELGLVKDLIWILKKTKFTFKNQVKKQIRDWHYKSCCRESKAIQK